RAGVEEARTGGGRLAGPLAPGEPAGERQERDDADRQQQPDELPALLPHEDSDNQTAQPDRGEQGAADVDGPIAGVRNVLDQSEAAEDHRDDDDLEQEADAPREEGGQEAAEQRTDRRGDRR